MPEVMGWLYDHLDKPWKNERRRLALDKLNTRPLVNLLKEYEPDIAICTHFLPSEILSWLKAKARIACGKRCGFTFPKRRIIRLLKRLPCWGW